jgi:hypothetical protein
LDVTVNATGDEHEGMPGDWQGFPGNEGSGNFWFLAARAFGPQEHSGDREHIVGSGLG